MGKYSKTYSNYLHRKVHQNTNDGTIFERDWGTLGERHVIESGKRKIYADSNFLFTDNNRPGTKKRNNTSEWSDAYTSDNITSRVNDEINNISNLNESNDIRDYAYYGSALELLRAAIEDIIKWFPARLWATETGVMRESDDDQTYLYLDSVVTDGHHNYAATYVNSETITPDNPVNMYTIANPFGIDLYTPNAVFTDNDNRQRNMVSAWQNYTINGSPLLTWDVWIKPYDECDTNYDIVYDITFTYKGDCITINDVEDEIETCVSIYDVEDNPDTIKTGHIYGMRTREGLIWCTDTQDLIIQPTTDIIENYFNNLDDFESVLLSRKSNPKYTAKFITPIEMPDNRPGYYYVERTYTWPNTGYCINVDTVGFTNYVNDLYKLGVLLDETWCDNLWRNMTHEAIKNFDWTYTREYVDGEEVDNIAGGTRMQHMLRIWGRSFDDVKRYIDAISLKNVITYSDFGNIGNAELSDKAELRGWEIYSTKENNNDNLFLTNDYINSITKLTDRWGGVNTTVSHENWFNTINPAQVSQNSVENNFMKKLILNSGGIFRSKGTRQSIEQVLALFGLGYNEFTLEERSYSVVPKRRDDIYYHYAANSNPDLSKGYVDLSNNYSTMEEYAEANNYTFNENSIPHIKIGLKIFDLIDYMTYGEFCKLYNSKKNIVVNYDDDEFSGIPLKTVYIDNDYYIVPYFTQTKIYDGDVQFESEGAWGKTIPSSSNVNNFVNEEYNYMETLPYMDVVQNVSALMGVNAYTIGNKTIYYVMDLSDLTDFVETVPTTTSHFFKLMDKVNPQLFANWKNVPLNTDNLSESGYNVLCSSNDLTLGCTYDDYLLCQYHDTMVLDNLGNNPHVGYASYDIGTKYLEYISEPFKYAAEHYGYSDLDDCYTVSRFRFEVTEHSDKIIDRTGDIGNLHNQYYLPSKLLILRNKMSMSNKAKTNFKSYFRNVILKYIIQIIPSTSLFILKEF